MFSIYKLGLIWKDYFDLKQNQHLDHPTIRPDRGAQLRTDRDDQYLGLYTSLHYTTLQPSKPGESEEWILVGGVAARAARGSQGLL